MDVLGQVALEIEANPEYFSPKTGYYNEKVGAKGDCSGKVTAIFRRAGRTDLTRCRAIQMYEGLCGWEGDRELFEEAKQCSLAFFDTKGLDEVSHVGIFTKKTFMNYMNMLAHASSSKGFIQVPVEKEKNDYFYKRFRGAKLLYGKRTK